MGCVLEDGEVDRAAVEGAEAGGSVEADGRVVAAVDGEFKPVNVRAGQVTREFERGATQTTATR